MLDGYILSRSFLRCSQFFRLPFIAIYAMYVFNWLNQVLRWSRRYIRNSPYYNNEIGNINLSQCCYIFRGYVFDVAVQGSPAIKAMASGDLVIVCASAKRFVEYQFLLIFSKVSSLSKGVFPKASRCIKPRYQEKSALLMKVTPR